MKKVYGLFGIFILLFVLNQIISEPMLFAQKISLHQKHFQYSKSQSSHSGIEKTLGDKEIDINQWTLYHCYAIFDATKLPKEFLSTTSERCGTWIFDEIRRNWSKLNEATKTILAAYGFNAFGVLARPIGLDSSRSTTHLKIHYSVTTGDTNAVSPFDGDGNDTPDYVDRVMLVLEEVWSYEITTMGYYPPPSDGIAGGDSKYDVYLFRIGTLYGYVQAEAKIGDNPNSPFNEFNAFSNYLAMRNDYVGFPNNEVQNIQVTAAHEYFHSIQFGYDGWEASWMMEATATWCEDEVYDGINDNYQYLSSWFDQPWIPLDANDVEKNNHWYGSWIFFRYISEHVVGRNTVRRIWEKSIDQVDSSHTDKSFDAIRDVLIEQGSVFPDVFSQFTVANLYKTISPYHYEEGNAYPNINIIGMLVGDQTIEDFLNRKAADYYQVSPNRMPRGTDVINITFTPLTAGVYFGVQVVTKKGNIVTSYSFANNFSLSPTKDLDEIVIIVMNYDKNQGSYRLRVQTDSKLAQLSFNNYDDSQPIISDGRAGWISHENYPVQGRFFNGKKIISTYSPVDIHGTQAAWAEPRDSSSTFNGLIKIYDLKNGKTIVIDPPNLEIVDEFPLLNNGKIAFIGTDITFPRYNAIYLTDTSKTIKRISNYFQPEIWLKIFQINNGQIIWGRHFYLDNIDTVFWYKDSMNIVPPTKFRKTVPRLSNGQLAWCESKTTSPDGPKELFFYDGTNTRMLTDDNISDNNADIHNGKIAWARDTIIAGKNRHLAFYDGTKIRLIVDTTTGLPKDVYNIKIHSGKIAFSTFGGSFGLDEAIFLYDGTSINQITSWLSEGVGTPSYGEYAGRIPLNNGQIAFAMKKGSYSEIFLYTHDSVATNVDDDYLVPGQFTLYQNYPNPFNASTTIKFTLVGKSKVALRIYNVLGQEVERLINEERAEGVHTIQWNPKTLSSGVYFYRLDADKYRAAKKLMLIK